MAVIQPNEECSPHSPEKSQPSPISTPLIRLSTIEGWETPHKTTDEKTFYSECEPRRVYWHTSSNNTVGSNEPRQISFTSNPSSTPPPPRPQKRTLSLGMSFTKKGVCRSTLARHAAGPTSKKYTLMLRKNSNYCTFDQTPN